MSNAGERVVGYDAREYWLDFDQTWTEERKRSFLYRLDVLKPLSVDVRVWATIFESERRPEPPGRFGFMSTWADLADLRATVTGEFGKGPLRAWRTIAITLLPGIGPRDDAVPWPERLPPVAPGGLAEGWKFLGYDVGDQFLLSALTNCGFLPGLEDVAAMRAEWGPRLNEFHLFPELDDAYRFKRFSDDRLKGDHAPCFVYGLWIVR